MKTKQKRKTAKKPKYGMIKCVDFMLGKARKHCVSVLWLCFADVAIAVCLNLAELFVTPTVLRKVEKTAPLSELLVTIGIFSGALLLLKGLSAYVGKNTLFGRISVRTEIIRDIGHKASVTSYPNVYDPNAVKLLSEAENHTTSNSEATEHIWETITLFATDFACFVIYLYLLSGLDLKLIAVVVATTVAGFFVNKRINGWEYRHREEKAQYEKELNYICCEAESIELAKDIRIFGIASWLNDVYDSIRKTAEAFICRREKIYVWTSVADVILQLARNGIAYVYLISLTLSQDLFAAEFLLYFTAFSGFSEWVTGILARFSELHKECLGISTVMEYLDMPERFRFDDGKPVPDSDSWELKLENVSFRYPGAEKDTISGMNLTVHSGEKLAIVGLNGAGKTTLVKLLCGFYDPNEGRVLLNGTDIREFNRRDYYGKFSAVFQDMSVLDVTVAEEVAQSVDKIDTEKVMSCLEKAGLSEKIASLPDGLNTHVGRHVYLDGVEFSGGETQRLMLARALYKDGPILMLDEPTAALDPVAENDIYMKYNNMTSGKTSVFISHRLASTRFCDRVLFLSDGAIAEEGTHEELLAMNGGYAALFDIQARYYQERREFNGEEIR